MTSHHGNFTTTLASAASWQPYSGRQLAFSKILCLIAFTTSKLPFALISAGRQISRNLDHFIYLSKSVCPPGVVVDCITYIHSAKKQAQ